MKRTSLLLLSLLSLATWIPSSTIAERISKQDSTSVIAYTIYSEARGEGNYGMCLVASVIWNRSVERHIEASEVCLQKKQFSCWNQRSFGTISLRAEKDRMAWKYASILASDIQKGRFRPFTNANQYYNPSLCSPSWGTKMKDSFTYKNHKFGRL